MYCLSKHFEKHLILRKHLTFFSYFQYMESLKHWLQRWLAYLVNCSICNTRIYIVMTRVRQQIITTHILFNISRNKDIQTMKSGQLIEYNIRNIFLGKSYSKCGGESSPRPLNKKLQLSISLDQQSKML